jgi:hypothetical protein
MVRRRGLLAVVAVIVGSSGEGPAGAWCCGRDGPRRGRASPQGPSAQTAGMSHSCRRRAAARRTGGPDRGLRSVRLFTGVSVSRAVGTGARARPARSR